MGSIVAVEILLLAGAYALWRNSDQTHFVVRFFCYLAVMVLFSLSLVLTLMGLGIDRWDDSSDWYWDTWLLFTSTAATGMLYAQTRFTGAYRVLLTILPVAGVIWLIVVYVSLA